MIQKKMRNINKLDLCLKICIQKLKVINNIFYIDLPMLKFVKTCFNIFIALQKIKLKDYKNALEAKKVLKIKEKVIICWVLKSMYLLKSS